MIDWFCGILLFTFTAKASVDLSGFVKSWIHSSATLTVATSYPNAVYNESFDFDSIYILGGESCPTCVSRYFISNDTLMIYDTLTYSVPQTLTRPGSVLINNNIFYVTDYGELRKYTIETKADESVFTIAEGGRRPCLTKHPKNTFLYMQACGNSGDCSYSSNFYVYSMENNSYTQGPSLNYARRTVTCVINDYDDGTYAL